VPLTEEYYVPEYCVGRIIGRGGQNIKEISVISNCKVKFMDRMNQNKSNSKANDINESTKELTKSQKKIISLTGSVEQINSAKVNDLK
jgi:transcription antitermination factor NusA-like protein